ncbi:MAG: hypothetical protein JST19_14220 [Bacteroidetes bacterium]|nr:hypothetical protein [Bacteroidota bacterium]
MNWVIRKSSKITCHTVIGEILRPLDDYIDAYNWVLADIEGGGDLSGLPIGYEHEYFILPSKEFRKIIDSDFQFYWGAVLAIPISIDIHLDEKKLPHVEGYPFIFENGLIQYPGAEIEIDCFDSGYTIVKFTNETMSDIFKTYFTEALAIDTFQSKYLK